MKNKLPCMKMGLLVICFILTVKIILAQQPLPVVKATSNMVDIRDGDDFKKGNWNISPEVKPDVYYAERFKGSKRVTFYTNLDSISFTVTPGETFTFIILLNNKDSAYTQISSVSPPKLIYTRNCTNCNTQTDTIPFSIGWNNTIQIKGSVNGSDVLNMIFDTGANGVVLSDDAYNKHTKVKIDGTIQGFGIGGSSQDEFSKSNTIKMADLTWNNVPLSVKHTGKPNADVVIGYNVFDGKIIEIDYDKKLLILHDSLPVKAKEYTKYDLQFKAGLSHIRLLLNDGKEKVECLFDFDTGSSETMFINNDFASENGLYNGMKKVGSDKLQGGGSNKIAVDKVLLPSLLIGGYELKDVRIGREEASAKEGPSFNIIGNDILKRFNAVIDYQNDVVYLSPNSLINDDYLYQRVNYVMWSGSALLLILTMVVIALFRKRIKKQSAKYPFA